MDNFRLHMSTELIVGPGEFANLGKEAAALGTKAMLITGRSSAKKLGYLDRAVESLQAAGLSVTVFDQIEPNPRHSTCDDGAAIVRNEGIDLLIALGGGSTMDAAKAIATSAKSGKSCWDHVFRKGGAAKVESALPIITIPTTAATGSEANAAAVITNWESNEKCALVNPLLVPAKAICDPELHITLPASETANGAMDILSHGLESYLNGSDDATVQDRITEGLFNTVLEWGPVAFKDGNNVRARRELMFASTIMIIGLPNRGRSGPWPIHAMEHALSGHYDIPHGLGLAILFPRYMRFMMEAVPNRLAQLGKRCFGIADATELEMAGAAVVNLVEWLEKIGLNKTLNDVGINDEKFEQMADDVLRNYTAGSFHPAPIELDKKALVAIFEMCLTSN
jgi:alcohol dehydrogenase YqhD (iron-dependent ADH family)